MNADPPFCLNARVPCTPAFSRPCPSGAGYARSLDNAYVPGELSPGSRADSARSARQYVKHKPCPNGVDNALIFQKNFWSSKMRDFRPRTSPKMTKNTLFYIVEDDRAQVLDRCQEPTQRRRSSHLRFKGRTRSGAVAWRVCPSTATGQCQHPPYSGNDAVRSPEPVQNEPQRGRQRGRPSKRPAKRPTTGVWQASGMKGKQDLRWSSERSGEKFRPSGCPSYCSGEDVDGLGVEFLILSSMLFDNEAEVSTVRDPLRETRRTDMQA